MLRNKGFNLVELSVSMVITSILLVVLMSVVVNVSGVIRDERVDGDASRRFGDFQIVVYEELLKSDEVTLYVGSGTKKLEFKNTRGELVHFSLDENRLSYVDSNGRSLLLFDHFDDIDTYRVGNGGYVEFYFYFSSSNAEHYIGYQLDAVINEVSI